MEKQERYIGKIVNVTDTDVLLIEQDDKILKVSSIHCTVSPSEHIGDHYIFYGRDVLGEMAICDDSYGEQPSIF